MDENERPGAVPVPPGEVPSAVAAGVPFGEAADGSRSPSGANEPSEGATGGCTGAGPVLAVTVLPASLNELELLVLREGLVGAAKAKAEPGPPNWVVDMANEIGFAGWHTRGVEARHGSQRWRLASCKRTTETARMVSKTRSSSRCNSGAVRTSRGRFGAANRMRSAPCSGRVDDCFFSLSLFETCRHCLELCTCMPCIAMPPKQKFQWRWTPAGKCPQQRFPQWRRSISLGLVSSFLVSGEPLTTRFHENSLRTSIMVEYPCIERSIHALSQLNAS
jgi:hypothetical protein